MNGTLYEFERRTLKGSSSQMRRRLKVLVSAYACNPYLGSEKGVGWGWVNAIGEHHDLWVLTGDIHKNDIEGEIATDRERYRNIRFYYIPRKRWLKLEKLWPPAYLWTYRLWQRAAYRLGAVLHAEVGFDLVHLVTYVGFRVPGYLWKLDIPFVWGPIGGLETTPWRFLPVLGLRGCLYYACRNIITSLQKRFLTLPKKAFRKANHAIIAATAGIRREILRWYGYDSEVICEIVPPRDVATDHAVRKPDEALRIAWSGLHLPGKALPLLLKALADLEGCVDWELDILGNGPSTARWQKVARELGVHGQCRWHGWVPRKEALALMRRAHLFVITSVKDLTSTVLLEALSQGVPVVCPNHCGFPDIVTPECGIIVDMRNPRQMAKDTAAAIMTLARDESRRRTMARGALHRITQFSAKNKLAVLNRIYQRQCPF